ncbi:MAG: hypothetical protein Kow0025_17220 [Thermodesulfovibrionales bacterium]
MGSGTRMPWVPLGRADDIHNLEIMDEADLVLFVAGNQFMAMEELLEDFRRLNPSVRKIFYETLPPGLELRQILAGGARFGDRVLTGTPDVYTSVSVEAMEELAGRGLVEKYFVYLHNRLVLLVREGNPLGIRGVQDLARGDVIVSQPGELEDITRHVRAMYLEAGGRELADRIMEDKKALGTTLQTTIHHRETPARLASGTADVGPVWATEAAIARRTGQPVEAVEVGPGLDQSGRVNYYAAKLSGSPNPANASRYLDYLLSGRAQEIYASYGFIPRRAEAP